MLKPFYEKADEVPEELKEHYTEKDGAFVLDGFVTNDKIKEFRTNNINLKKLADELQGQLLEFKDIDPVKHAEAAKKLQELENKRLVDANEWGVLKSNLETAHLDSMKEANKKSENIQDGWNKEKIANQAAMVVLKHAVPAEGNMQYIQSDIQKIATIDPQTQEIVFLNEKGIKIENEAKDGNLTLEEYMTKTYIPKSSLFQKSEGGGALGGKDIQMVTQGQVRIENISGIDIPGSMIDDLASGKIKAI